MKRFARRATQPPAGAKVSHEKESDAELDELLSEYVVNIPDSTMEAIYGALAKLPDHDRLGGRAGGSATPLFWPGVGLAFGMLLLGFVIGSDGVPASILPGDVSPEFSDLVIPQGT